MRSSKLFFLAAILFLFFIALVRGCSLLFNEPLIGLANNFDMVRVQGCIRAYPARTDGAIPWAQSPQGPLLRYRFDKNIDPGCYFSTESWLAKIYKPVLKKQGKLSSDGTFSIRSYGAFKLFLLLSSGLIISFLMFRQGLLFPSLVNAALFATALTDPGVTVYLNGFYAEFSAVLFSYLSVALAFLIICKKNGSRLDYLFLASCMVLICLTKIQHFAFSLVLLVVVSVSMAMLRFERKSAGQLLFVMLFAAILGAGIQVRHMQGNATSDIRKANITNTVLQAVLGSSAAPETTARLLGLPSRCVQHAGKTWFSPGVIESHPCPEVFDVSRVEIAMLFFKDPLTMVNALIRGVENARPWIPAYLGVVEGASHASLPADIFSLDRLISRLPRWGFLAFFFAPLAISFSIYVMVRRNEEAHVGLILLIFLSSYPQFSLLSVIFGDGLADVAKQFNLGMLSLLSFWCVAVLFLLHSIARIFARRYVTAIDAKANLNFSGN